METYKYMYNEGKEMVHIHNHLATSFLDGYGLPKDRAKRAKELGMTSLAITDHNHLGGCVDFQRACIEQGIKPILGVELYYTEDSSILSSDAKSRELLATSKALEAGVEIPPKAIKKVVKELIAPYAYNTKQFHIIFLAKNKEGWSNLVKLQSEAARLCTYNGRFCADDALIEKYKDGLIMTTACLGNIVNNYIMKGEITKAYAQLDKWHKMFGDDFYVEIQPLNNEEQALCNYHLIQYAITHNANIVSTNDVHYTRYEDIDDHDTLLCIGLGKLKSDTDRMRYAPEFWLRSYDEMVAAFSLQYNANEYLNEKMTLDEYLSFAIKGLNNTCSISDKIADSYNVGSDKPILPKLPTPAGLSSEEYLTLLSYKGLFKYISTHSELNFNEYLDRLSFELNVINSKGYADYMLIYRDLVEWCEIKGIPVGPGRGSAAGSLCLYVNGITKCIDPIKYGLLFSRFLTMDRSALPDIDTDFSYLNRQRVVQYLKDKYGEECVSFIGTYTELGVKNGLKDVGRVLNIDFATMNALSKKIDIWTDEAPSIKFKDLDKLAHGNAKEQAVYREFSEVENEYKELFRLARAFEGTPRNQGVHASGILVTPMPINDMFPTRYVDGNAVTLYTGPQVEEVGGVKLDVLGLKTLDVLDLTIKAVDPSATVYQLYDMVDNYLDNEEMFSALCRKETEGIFQLESALFKGLVSDMLPDKLDDITLITSFGRPGPLSAGLHTSFAKRKRGEEEAVEPLPNTWDIVEDSLGVLAYQEHTMRIAQRVAGFDDNQADSFLRKAQAKKKRDLLDLCNQWFVYGKVNEEPPAGYDYSNKSQPYYDPTAKYGTPIIGGIMNGYDEKELIGYNHMIEGFCSYLFNKSHAACYSFISVCTMYLKTFYRVEFMAALLSLQSKQEKIDLYCKIANGYNIEISTPDVNLSNENFTAVNGKILYGLGSIKGVGAAAIPTIIAQRPYTDLADAYEKAGKKAFNKKIGECLIKAGAFDFLSTNRNSLLNIFQDIRKAKKEDRFEEDLYDEDTCIGYETDVLGSPITYKPYWDTVIAGEVLNEELELNGVREKVDKNGNMMAFIDVTINKCKVKGVVFASTYCKNSDAFNKELNKSVYAQIKKDDKGGFILNKVLKGLPKTKTNTKETDISNIDMTMFNNLLERVAG